MSRFYPISGILPQAKYLKSGMNLKILMPALASSLGVSYYIEAEKTMAAIFQNNIFKCTFLSENVWISIRISLKFVPWVPIDNKLALVQIMAWHLTGDKP